MVLTLLTFHKWELTITSGILLVLLPVVIITGVLCIFLESKLTEILYAGVGTLLFGIFGSKNKLTKIEDRQIQAKEIT
ncbi:protein lifeguard 1-like [Liasis olivaceus]